MQKCLLLAVRGGRFELSRRHQLVFQSLRGDRQGRTLGRSRAFSYGFVHLVVWQKHRFCTGKSCSCTLLLDLCLIAFASCLHSHRPDRDGIQKLFPQRLPRFRSSTNAGQMHLMLLFRSRVGGTLASVASLRNNFLK